MDLAQASHEQFAELADDTFTVEGAAIDAVKLVRVVPRTKHPESVRCPFTLVFRAQGSEPMPQSIYHLKHAVLGSMDIFLVPVEQGTDHVIYEAVFN